MNKGSMQQTGSLVVLREDVAGTEVADGATYAVTIPVTRATSVKVIVGSGAIHTYKVDLSKNNSSDVLISSNLDEVAIASASQGSVESAWIDVDSPSVTFKYTNQSGGGTARTVYYYIYGRVAS